MVADSHMWLVQQGGSQGCCDTPEGIDVLRRVDIEMQVRVGDLDSNWLDEVAQRRVWTGFADALTIRR